MGLSKVDFYIFEVFFIINENIKEYDLIGQVNKQFLEFLVVKVLKQ